MQEGEFAAGLKIIEQAFRLVGTANMQQFMRNHSPLKVILQRYITGPQEDKVAVLQFLTSYAREDQGAEHLSQEGVLKTLSLSSLIAQMNVADFYVADGHQRRNPVHLQWCHCLLLVRTLNQSLLPDSPDQRRQLPS